MRTTGACSPLLSTPVSAVSITKGARGPDAENSRARFRTTPVTPPRLSSGQESRNACLGRWDETCMNAVSLAVRKHFASLPAGYSHKIGDLKSVQIQVLTNTLLRIASVPGFSYA